MDENTRTQIIILIVGIIIGGGLYLSNSLFLYGTSVNKDKSEVSEGL